MPGKRKKILAKRVDTRVSLETYRRLNEVKNKYKFKSVYDILQSLIHCFLRYADPDNDPQKEDPLPKDIEDMFDDMSEGERHVEFSNKPKRRTPHRTPDDARNN